MRNAFEKWGRAYFPAGVPRKIGPTPFFLLLVLIAAACGKKGPPLPPLQHIPSAPSDFVAQRVDDAVYVALTVPSANVDGERPADVARVEVYAITLAEVPAADAHVQEEFRQAATLVATDVVRRPLPPLPEPPPGTPPLPPLPQAPGVDQGTRLTIREALTAAVREPVPLPRVRDAQPAKVETAVETGLSLPAVMRPGDSGPVRYYFAVPVTTRGRYGPVSPLYPVPLGATSRAPAAPRIEYDAATLTVTWDPPADARTAQMAPATGDLLPARPVVPGGQPTRYNVYLAPATGASPGPVAAPTPLNAEPLAEPKFVENTVTFGAERCFVVRPVDAVGGAAIDGPASPPACVTPKDTFPPDAPTSLAAVTASGAISLIWDANDEGDLAGYIVLRGEAPGATLQPLTAEPVKETTFRDERVTPGTRYVYAVIAVDTAGNPSAQSARVEETARQ